MKSTILAICFAAVALATVAAFHPVQKTVTAPAVRSFDDPGAPPPLCPPFCGEKKQ